jgi:N-acetylglucosaminyl-diphospho-decaprenol L-rhamnosyltransferase
VIPTEPATNRPPPRGRDPQLTVVIVNYNGWPDVRRLVATLAASPEVADGSCEVVVVDNASQDPIPPDFARLEPGVRLVLRRENDGFAAGVNTGWHAARSRWLLVLNPDVVVPEGTLGQILGRVTAFEGGRDEAPGIVGFGLRNPDGSRQPSVGVFPSLARTLREQLIPRSRRKYQPGWKTRPGPVDWVTGACVLVNARMLADVGGMDEDFFLYHEEVALCRSAQDRGWRVEYDPAIEVVHLHPLQNRAISPRMRVITRHSKLLYFRKHLPRRQFLTLTRGVLLEAEARGTLARIRGRTEDAQTWRAIAELARAFRAGVEPRGRDVRVLAEAATTPHGPGGADPGPIAIGPAGMRREALKTAPLQPRKDGPSCR